MSGITDRTACGECEREYVGTCRTCAAAVCLTHARAHRQREHSVEHVDGRVLVPCEDCKGAGVVTPLTGPRAGVEGRCPDCEGLRYEWGAKPHLREPPPSPVKSEPIALPAEVIPLPPPPVVMAQAVPVASELLAPAPTTIPVPPPSRVAPRLCADADCGREVVGTCRRCNIQLCKDHGIEHRSRDHGFEGPDGRFLVECRSCDGEGTAIIAWGRDGGRLGPCPICHGAKFDWNRAAGEVVPKPSKPKSPPKSSPPPNPRAAWQTGMLEGFKNHAAPVATVERQPLPPSDERSLFQKLRRWFRLK